MGKILLVGNGGREHAMGLALLSGDEKPQLLVAPGNPGTAALGENVGVQAADVEGLAMLAKDEAVDMVIVGPEAPLVGGLAGLLRKLKIPCCGPSEMAAQLEGSKLFTRELAEEALVPSPRFLAVTKHDELKEALDGWRGLPVIKADGLAGGKGVYLPESKEECVQIAQELLDGKLGDAGRTVVLEERLVGTEASLFYACSGTDFVALPHARDHKRLLDADQGPNTGGMGAVSPNPAIDSEIATFVAMEVIGPTLHALKERGTPFHGFLFAGLMLTDDGPKLLEYNVRLGDPEAQAILPRLQDGEFLRLCRAIVDGQLADFELRIRPEATCAIVLCADGYPDSPRKGDTITVGDALNTDGRWLIHAGTRENGGGLVTHGGRVAAVVALGHDVETARADAYQGVDMVRFDGMQIRRDIGGATS